VTVADEPRERQADGSRMGPERRGLAITLVLLLSGAMLGTRLWGLSHSLWWDEAYSAWAYITRPGAIRDPERYLGNNHVLFSWLSHQTTDLTASTWEPIIRFWSVFPGLAGTAILVAWLWRRTTKPLALTTLGLLLVSVAHADRIPEARGYGLVFLGSVLLVAAGSEAAAERPSVRADLAFVAGGVVGAAAIPTLALAALPQGAATLASRGGHRGRLVLAGAIGTSALVLWYWPLREPMLYYRTTVGSRSGDAVTPLNFLTLPFDHLMSQPIGAFLPMVPVLAVQIVAYALAVAGSVYLIRSHRSLAVQALSGTLGAMLLLGAFGLHAHPRYLFFLLPQVSIITAAGMLELVRSLRRRVPDRLLVPFVAVVIILGLVQGLAQVMEARRVPRQAFAESVRAVLESDVDRLYTDRLHIGFRWYLGERADEVITVEEERLEEVVCSSPGSAAYLPYARARTRPEPLSCFDDPSWSLVDPPAVHPTTVWIRTQGAP
jgi:hypothetical protein